MKLLDKLLLVFLFVSLPLFAEDEEDAIIEESDSAPTWLLTQDEIAYGSAQLEGKPYVIHFWATWCPYCKRLQPGLESIAVDYKKTGIETYAISFWENVRANPIREMKNRGLNLNVLVQGDDVAKSFGVQGTPTTIFVNHEGTVVSRYTLSDPNDPQIRLAYETLSDQFKDKDKPKVVPEDEG